MTYKVQQAVGTPILRLENWSIHVDDNGARYLNGDLYDHPVHPPGSPVSTGALAPALESCRVVATQDGALFLLGMVAPDYRDWCVAQGLQTDEGLDGPTPLKLVEAYSELNVPDKPGAWKD